MKMILSVLNDPGKVQNLLEAWAGRLDRRDSALQHRDGPHQPVRGYARKYSSDALPSDFYGSEKELSRTLFTIVKDDETAISIIAASRAVIGDLGQPNKGLLVILPFEHTDGSEKKR